VMAFQHQMQRQRYELKYIVDETTARRVRDFARCHLERDEYAVPAMGHRYPIYSLYLDGPKLPMFNSVLEGHKNRYKLRLRYYDEKPASPVFFEIKRRVGSVCEKSRALVKREQARSLLT